MKHEPTELARCPCLGEPASANRAVKVPFLSCLTDELKALHSPTRKHIDNLYL